MSSRTIRRITVMGSIGVMATFLLSQSAFIINPALSSIAKLYPNIPYSTILLLSTIVSLLIIPFSIIGAAVAGTKMTYRSLFLISILFVMSGGMAPFFIDNFYLLLVARAFVGIGIGLSSPLGNALIIRLFSDEKRAVLQGIGTAVMNISGVLFQQIAGIVCLINVKYTWLVYLVLIIPLAFVFFIPEPEKLKNHVNEDGKHIRMPSQIYFISAAYGLIFMFFFPVILNMSSILTSEKIDSPAVAGTILSMYSVGGMCGGLFFGRTFQLFKKWVMPASFAGLIVGMALCCYSQTIALLIVGSFAIGYSIFTIWPASIMEMSTIVPPASITLSTGIFVAFVNVGAFLSSSYIGFVNTIFKNSAPRFPIFVGMIAVTLIAIVWSVSVTEKKQHK